MATLTIRNLDDELKHSLRRIAANSHRSMEAEAREALRQYCLQKDRNREHPIILMRRLVAEKGGVDISLSSVRDESNGEHRIPDFTEEAQ